MRISKLYLQNYGPFISYEINFPEEEQICLLLTGKNNQGKSTLISALKLVHFASKIINRQKQIIRIEGNKYYRLLQQDVEDLNIGRLIYNYEGDRALIKATFSDNFEIHVFLDKINDIIYSDYIGKIPSDISSIFGFIPPLGQLAEDETLISNLYHLRKSLNTTLAPRHLRNHFFHFLSNEDFEVVKDIINSSWEEIELLNYEFDSSTGQINCFFKEKGITREISWAGQGLQVWFQIITHLVRLVNTSILILDEPEIFLYPQKQNELIQILKEYYYGSIIIATHSVELMNNVDISHIINVKKTSRKPKVKTTNDRIFLEIVRSQIGSNFNFIASQFDDVDLFIFTEDSSDFNIIRKLAKVFSIHVNAFNIPIYGFNEYKKSIFYKESYELFFGRKINYSLVLDRDYYPEEYLNEIKNKLESFGINVIFTPGKEIENLILNEQSLKKVLNNNDLKNKFEEFLDKIFNTEYDDCLGSFLTLHEKFSPKNIDTKTILKIKKPYFDSQWHDVNTRFDIIGGKILLRKLRNFFKKNLNLNLSVDFLISKLLEDKGQKERFEKFINSIYTLNNR